MACLTLPGIAYLAGVRPENLENRQPAPLPPVSAERLLDLEFYSALDRHISDTFPMKTAAVRVRAGLELGALRSSPASYHVVVGNGDWLYFDQEVFPPCVRNAAQTLEQLDRVAAAFRSADVPFRMVIAPDKRTIHPEGIPYGLRYESCTDRLRSRFRAGMELRPATMTDLWAPLLEARARSPGQRLYWLRNSHWEPVGAITALPALIEALAPGVWDADAVVVDGIVTDQGDLARLAGLPQSEQAPRVQVRRALALERRTIATSDVPGRETIRYIATGTDPVVPGRTLIVYDSFFGVVRDLIVPWFQESVWLHVGDLSSRPAIVNELPDFDRIIVERVERIAYQWPIVPVLRPLVERVGGSLR
jgi:hypothetical protein